MKNILTINSIFKFILKHKYYFIITFVLSCIFTLMHVSSVNKKYETFIYIRMSPEYLTLNKNNIIEKSSSRVYLKLFEEKFFEKKKLILFLGLDYFNKIFKTRKDSNIAFLDNKYLKIEVGDDFMKIFIDSSDLKFIQIFLNYLNQLNFELSQETIDREAYLQIDIEDVLDNKNINLNSELINSIKVQKKEARLKKYMLDNSIKIFSIDRPTEPKLIYPIITQFFINYFLVLNIIIFLFLFLKERKIKI